MVAAVSGQTDQSAEDRQLCVIKKPNLKWTELANHFVCTEIIITTLTIDPCLFDFSSPLLRWSDFAWKTARLFDFQTPGKMSWIGCSGPGRLPFPYLAWFQLNICWNNAPSDSARILSAKRSGESSQNPVCTALQRSHTMMQSQHIPTWFRGVKCFTSFPQIWHFIVHSSRLIKLVIVSKIRFRLRRLMITCNSQSGELQSMYQNWIDFFDVGSRSMYLHWWAVCDCREQAGTNILIAHNNPIADLVGGGNTSSWVDAKPVTCNKRNC